MTSDAPANKPNPTAATKPIRSPSYPNMSLRDAISSVTKIEGRYRTAAVDRSEAVRLIGYSGLSGPANKALAALAHYGLVERAGKGDLRVTRRAVDILHGDVSERSQAISEAAVDPDLFGRLHKRFPGITPPESGVISFLNREGFNPTAVRPAAKAFLETMAFVEELKGIESHSDPRSVELASPIPPDESERRGGAQVGDHVQWESQGALQFETPRRVRWVHEDGTYLAVEGSDTGLPMNEIIVEARGGDTGRTDLRVPPETAPEQSTDLNKIRTSFDDTTVRISAWLDAAGVAELERKLAGIKLMLGISDQGRGEA